MDMHIARLCYLLLLFNSINATGIISGNNDTESKDRQPRVNGRIVKLYSGTRPEPVHCPQEGFQADPTECSVFYRCVKGANNKYTVFRFQCGPGTVYDPDTEVCNFPQSTRRSECGGISQPSVDRNNENEIEGVRPELPRPINTRPVYPVPSNENTTLTMYPWATSIPEISQSKSTNFSWMAASYQESSTKNTLIQSQVKPTRQGSDTCTKDGFMGDSENCRKFYRCVGNQRGGFLQYEFSCSETTVWDDDVQSCNHPWAVQRSRCGRSESDNNIKPSRPSSHTSNNQTPPKATVQEQLQINYGEKVKQTQSQISNEQVIQNQTQINYGDRKNNKKSNSKAKQNQTQISYGSAISQSQTQINYGNGLQTQLQIDHTKESSQAQAQTYETTSKATTVILQDEMNQGYDLQSSTQANVNEDQNSNECGDSGFMGDKNDCKKFYRCVDNGKGGYIKYEFACGEGTVWDSSIEACNHEWAVKECGGKVPESSSQSALQTTTTIKTSSQNYQTTSEFTTIDDSEDTGYGNPNQQPEIPSTTTTQQPNSVSTTTLGSSSSDGTKCTSTGFKKDPNDCKKFYRCVDNGKGSYTKYEYNCGEGTVWDEDIEACNHPWAVKKCGSAGAANSDANTIETTSTQSTTITVSLVQTSTQPSPENVDSGYGEQPSDESSSTTKQPQNGEKNECTSSGFMGDKNDCKKFYRCVDNGNGSYTRYEFSCGEGTVWDPKIEACNHAWAVEKCGVDDSDIYKETTSNTRPTTSDIYPTQPSSSPSTTVQSTTTTNISSKNECTQEGFMGDKNDCKKFYRCVDNGQGGYIKYDFSCGEGTVWDTEINSCNHPSSDKRCDVTGSTNSGSEISTEPNRENDEQYIESTESNHSVETSTKDTQTAIPSQTPQNSDDKCTSEGFYGNSRNCKKFYRCVDNGKGDYTKYEFTCGDGTTWDQEIQACNHEPSDSKCSKDTQTTSPQATTEGDTSSSSSSTTQVQESTQTQIPSSESSGNCTSEGFYANPSDCKKFYRCVDNGKGGYTKYDFSCGEGTMWVQEIQACDHDSGESCTSYSSSTTETLNVESPSNSTSENVSNQQPDKQDDESPIETSSGSSSPSDDSGKCAAEGFYPNKKDCRKFYRCVDNGHGGYTKHDFACGEGTAWDSDIQSCNHISDVKSCQGQEQESSQPMHDEETLQSPSSTSSGSTQSSTSGPVTESSKPSNKDTCEMEGYYGNSEDCTKFYRCVDNGKGGFTKYDFTCGEGTIWDQDITTCNHPQDVTNPSCQQSDSSSSSSSSTTSSTSSSSESSSSTTESGSSDCSQSSTKKPDSKNVNCTKAGYYPDPNDCKKFYRCVDWDGDGKRFSVYHFECGEGTIWDPALDTCNHEDSVYPPRDCTGSAQSQGENVDQESSTTESTSTTESIQESSTEKTTTQESTSEQTTTKQPTTSEQTTTTGLTTSQETTTNDQTTTSEQTTATEQTTSQQTTTQPTTINEQTTTSEQTTITEQTTSQQTTTQLTTTNEQTTSQQTTTQESTSQESTTEQSGTTEQTSSTTDSDQQSTTQQTTDSTESTTTESTTEQSTTNQTEESETTESSTSTANESTTTEKEQESTTESSSESSTQSNTPNNECPTTDEDQNIFVCPTSFRRHPKYCNMFYQCTEDDDTHDLQIANFHCPNNTIYDESKTQCVDEKKADKKCDGELAQKRRLKRLDTIYKEPIVVTNERLKCPSTGHYPFEQGECSPAFLKCQKTKTGRIRGFVYQCPQEYIYWAVSRRCEPRKHVRDCKKSRNDWKGRWEIPIERRNVAP